MLLRVTIPRYPQEGQLQEEVFILTLSPIYGEQDKGVWSEVGPDSGRDCT